MTVLYLENMDVTTRKNVNAVGRRRSDSLAILRWKSSPAGIDWRMIRSMREAIRRKKTSA